MDQVKVRETCRVWGVSMTLRNLILDEIKRRERRSGAT